MTEYALRQREFEDERATWVEKRYRHADVSYYGPVQPGWRVEMWPNEYEHQLDPEAPVVTVVASTITSALVEARRRWDSNPYRLRHHDPVVVKTHIVTSPEVFCD